MEGVNRVRLDARRVARIRIALWVTLTSVSLVFVAASTMSAINYTDVAMAKLAVSPVADLNITTSNLGPSGEVTDDTVFHYVAYVNVTNPSRKDVVLQFMKYQGWIRDYYMENLTHSHVPLAFSMIVADPSFRPTDGLIAANSVKDFYCAWNFSRTDNSGGFEYARDIMNFARTSLGLGWRNLEMTHYFVFMLKVTGVPSDYTGPNSSYLIELPVIRKEQVTTWP
jgi:hypothetical protein